MELKSCPNCKERISINDTKCPYCNYIDDKRYKKENDKLKKQNITNNKENYCFNCGEKLSKDYCSKCGMQILTKKNKSENRKTTNSKVCIIILLSTLVLNLILFFLFNNVNEVILLSVISLIVISQFKSRYTENKFINAIYWIYSIVMILEIIFFVIFMYFCYSLVKSCPV